MILDDYILMSYTFRLVGVTFKHSLDSGHCKTAPHFHITPPRMFEAEQQQRRGKWRL